MMTRIHKIVKEELSHIPRGNLDQNMLRSIYSGMRLHSLGRRAERRSSKEDILVNATKNVRKGNLSFCPIYDKKFFDKDKIYKIAKNDKKLLACFYR